MRILTTINDVRKYRQLGRQVNQENFEGITREVQENELTELLGESLSYDFFNYLDNGWANQAGTFTRDSANQFTAVGIDLSTWNDYALRINDEVFVIVDSATFNGSDTIIVTTGYDLPESVTIVDYKTVNDYIKLLNGTSYQKNNEPIKYNGLRPYVSWKFLAIYSTEGSYKQSDIGNISIMPDRAQNPSGSTSRDARSIRLQNSLREYNRIIDFLNENKTAYPLWKSDKQDENLTNLEMILI